MNRVSIKLTRLIIFSMMMMAASAAWGTELYIPALKAKPGESVKVPIMLDQIDNLAGVKLVMKYDSDMLEFKKADKTRQTSSLMHIVNSKNPGIVVVVMAGARGVKGKDFPILLMTFEIKKKAETQKTAKIEIKDLQLMSDQLKEIVANIKVNPLAILTDTLAAEPVVKSEIRESEKEVKKKNR